PSCDNYPRPHNLESGSCNRIQPKVAILAHLLPTAPCSNPLMGRMGEISRKHFFGNVSGATAVEFAMLFPVYLMLFLGMTGYGIYFGASHSVQQLAADAARAALAGLDTAERRRLADGFIRHNAAGYPFID